MCCKNSFFLLPIQTSCHDRQRETGGEKEERTVHNRNSNSYNVKRILVSISSTKNWYNEESSFLFCCKKFDVLNFLFGFCQFLVLFFFMLDGEWIFKANNQTSHHVRLVLWTLVEIENIVAVTTRLEQDNSSSLCFIRITGNMRHY